MGSCSFATESEDEMSKEVDAVVEAITENMLAGVVEGKYESLEEDIAKILGVLEAYQAMKLVKRYFPPEVEYAAQLADLMADLKAGS